MSLLTRWADFLDGQVALAEVEESGTKMVADVAEASALISHWGGAREDRVNISKAHRTVDDEVVKARDAVQLAYANRKLLTTMYNSCERDAALLSRELTRRTERDPVERRTDRYTT